ncbi:M1 family metallopeptidase [Adhaeribacter aquaticus]|uniref:M1 family metallopeptidase n=1 Tax=Adhaeribacter aquaticus TaxID=299567 RepID=UPI0003F8EC29|nr:M1 family metallopeptidase [Adhaeribacter aquaticus]
MHSFRSIYFYLLLLFWSPTLAIAQQKLPVPKNIQATFLKGTRTENGKPGSNYWQNTADYTIKVNFDPRTRRVAGTVDIVYVNNSPDSLKQIWFKLYPNLYQKGAPRDVSIDPEDIGEGIKIEQFSFNNNALDPNKLVINNTNLPVRIKTLAPKATGKFSISYSYILNKGSHNRTGQVEEGAYFIAYFFPRIAVYDDIDGWNKHAYTGSQEFYNDFCNFRAEVTVPQNYVVWATGDLTNANQVLKEKYVQRLQKAETSDASTNIIEKADIKQKNITAANAHNTWIFEAKEVTDFVFATSDHYVWQASSLVVDPQTKRRTRVDAVYNPDHKDFEEVVSFARKTVEAMSFTFPKWSFPYAHITVFDGLDQMEYPMMVNDNPLKERSATIELTDHEIFHTMFPFYMGTNETKYGWMDEGWATLGEWLISPMIDPAIIDDYGVEAYAKMSGTEIDSPIITLSTQQAEVAFFLNSYPKPALGYLYVKDMLGDDLFTKALHTYIDNWKGKHPMPYDFFNSMNAGAGRNLDWFWQRWFFDSGSPDLAIGQVTQSAGKYQVVIENKGTKPVPIDLKVTFDDKTVRKIHHNISVWEEGNTNVTITITTPKQIKHLTLGSSHVPDSNPANNQKEVK